MRKLIFITQQVDPGHPALAATVPKIRALAARVDEVVVLADRTVAGALPGQLPLALVRRRGRAPVAAPASRRRSRGSSLPRPVAVVAHMCPIYAVLAAPLVRPLRVPLLLWYTHWARTRTLEAAARAATAIVTRRPALVPDRLDEGRADRARHRPGRVPLRRPLGRRAATSGSPRSAATRARRGSRRSCAA